VASSVAKNIGKTMTGKDLPRRAVDLARPCTGPHRRDRRIVRLENSRRNP
jgi:hypothetical protein